MVKIFPKAIVHEKKAIVGGIFKHHIDFQGKRMPKAKGKIVPAYLKTFTLG